MFLKDNSNKKYEGAKLTREFDNEVSELFVTYRQNMWQF